MPTPSREEFVEAVKSFKTTHKGKLKDLLKDSDIAREFLSDEIIRNYLARPFEDVEKNSRGEPDLTDCSALLKKRVRKHQYEFNDHYELKFYKSVLVPYRKNLVGFSGEGALFGYATIFNKMLTSCIKNESKISISKIIEDDDYAINSFKNTIFTRFMDLNDKAVFHITPIWDLGMEHSFTLLTIFDKDTRNPLLILKLDASVNTSTENLNTMACPIIVDLENPKEDAEEKLIIDYLEKKFHFNPRDFITDPKTLISEEAGSIVKIDNSKSVEPEWVKHRFQYFSKNKKLLFLDSDKKPPYFDVSHDIQPTNAIYLNNAGKVVKQFSSDSDNNCALYSLNIIKGLCDMLNNDDIAEHIYQLAKQLEDNPANKACEDELLKIFKTDLKAFLPCYYKPDGSKKSPDELRDFHNQQKWNIGNKWLLENLQNTEELNNTSRPRL